MGQFFNVLLAIDKAQYHREPWTADKAWVG